MYYRYIEAIKSIDNTMKYTPCEDGAWFKSSHSDHKKALELYAPRLLFLDSGTH